MKNLDFSKPMVVEGRKAEVIHSFGPSRIVVVIEGSQRAINYEKFAGGWYPCTGGVGGQLTNQSVVKTYTLDVYPSTNTVYKRYEPRRKPCNSSYADMFSVTITEIDGVVVNKEFV